MSAGQHRVLVVEDDNDSAALLVIALGRKGFEVLAVPTCAAARAACAEGRVDAIVVDVSLPDGTGYDLVPTLSPRPRVAVILSGYDGDQDRERTLALGCAAHLVKPVDVTALATLLTESLDRAP